MLARTLNWVLPAIAISAIIIQVTILSPHTISLFGVAAFAVSLWVWVREYRGSKEPGVREWMAGLLVAGFFCWAVLFGIGLSQVKDSLPPRILAGIGLAVPTFIYLRYVARCLRDQVRASDWMLLLGVFVVCPAIFMAPFYILGRPTPLMLISAKLGMYFSIFTFIALSTAWAKGAKPGIKPDAEPTH